jgi:hypothetical protein
MKIIKISALIGLLAAACAPARAQDFRINQKEYFENAGAGVMVYSDACPEGHQGGVTLVLNGHRPRAPRTSTGTPSIALNRDCRLMFSI